MSNLSLKQNQGGLAACPADASSQVKSIASFCAHSRGGEGAVRDILEHYFTIDY